MTRNRNVTEQTARLVEGWFRLGDLGTRPVKGAREAAQHTCCAIRSPVRCCATGHRCRRSRFCFVTAASRLRRSTPRSMSPRCGRSRNLGQECGHVSPRRSIVPVDAASRRVCPQRSRPAPQKLCRLFGCQGSALPQGADRHRLGRPSPLGISAGAALGRRHSLCSVPPSRGRAP